MVANERNMEYGVPPVADAEVGNVTSGTNKVINCNSAIETKAVDEEPTQATE